MTVENALVLNEGHYNVFVAVTFVTIDELRPKKILMVPETRSTLFFYPQP